MKKTIISHFYNEEFLLPFWLNHHKQYFDHGILIDYNSTDKSVEIIRSICPSWTVVKSVNPEFDCVLVDQEVMDIERAINGYKICLNITEFLLGDFNILTDIPTQYLIPCMSMVDTIEDEFKLPNAKLSLLDQRYHAIPYNMWDRRLRSFHNYNEVYPVGRHYAHEEFSNNFLILWYGFSPFTEDLIQRKIQIAGKMSFKDKRDGNGSHHITTRDKQIQFLRDYQKQLIDIRPLINKFLK